MLDPNNENDELILRIANNKSITSEEEKRFDKLCQVNQHFINMYKEVKLSRLEGSSWDYWCELHRDFVSSTVMFFKVGLKFPYLYRLVVNESLPENSNQRIYDARFLKYPPLEIVKKINRYGRANTPDTNMFYATENIDGALRELRPKKGSLVTIGKWKCRQKYIFVFPIAGIEEATVLNRKQQDNYAVLMGTIARMNPQLARYLKPIVRFYAQEFAKVVDHSDEHYHKAYLYTAQFTKYILSSQTGRPVPITLVDDPDQEFDPLVHIARQFEKNLPATPSDAELDGITYPSVENLYSLENVALKPSSLDNKYYLESAYEFQVTNERYDITNPTNNYYGQLDELKIQCIDHTPIQTSRTINDSEINW